VAVVGAGQAGLSAAYHLRRRGLGYVVLDGENGPGGAWRHRWRSLPMATERDLRPPGPAQAPG
jgi:cation diffusion facilitator CzcD-associated flavoprotein CzcO